MHPAVAMFLYRAGKNTAFALFYMKYACPMPQFIET
jgi:hypothetical protein